MQVVDHEPGAWFLLQEDGNYFLDINCDRSMVSFSVIIKLTEEEFELYTSDGRAHIDVLAIQISNKSDPCDPRNLRDSILRDKILRSIIAWNENR